MASASPRRKPHSRNGFHANKTAEQTSETLEQHGLRQAQVGSDRCGRGIGRQIEEDAAENGGQGNPA